MKNQVIKQLVYFVILLDITILFLNNLLFYNQNFFQNKEEPLKIESTEIKLDNFTSGPPEQKIDIITYSIEDLKYLSSIIYCEAGNQCEAGKQAVGIVVLNRVKNENFENTIKGVIYEKGQFTPVGTKIFNTALTMFDSNNLPSECINAAFYALEGNTIIEYNEKEYNIDFLYFCRSKKGASLQIEDHYFR